MVFVFSEKGKENREECKTCPLYQNKFVLGRGIMDADVLIVGEAPGEIECRSGAVFTGRSGSLLNKELNRIGLWNYWITNVVKCCHFPKDFSPNLLQFCTPLLENEIQGRTKVIALGKVAREAIGATEWGILNKKNCALFHPGYILRRPTERKPFTKQWDAVKDWIEEDTTLTKRMKI